LAPARSARARPSPPAHRPSGPRPGDTGTAATACGPIVPMAPAARGHHIPPRAEQIQRPPCATETACGLNRRAGPGLTDPPRRRELILLAQRASCRPGRTRRRRWFVLAGRTTVSPASAGHVPRPGVSARRGEELPSGENVRLRIGQASRRPVDAVGLLRSDADVQSWIPPRLTARVALSGANDGVQGPMCACSSASGRSPRPQARAGRGWSKIFPDGEKPAASPPGSRLSQRAAVRSHSAMPLARVARVRSSGEDDERRGGPRAGSERAPA
jgi:hypothetical protein